MNNNSSFLEVFNQIKKDLAIPFDKLRGYITLVDTTDEPRLNPMSDWKLDGKLIESLPINNELLEQWSVKLINELPDNFKIFVSVNEVKQEQLSTNDLVYNTSLSIVVRRNHAGGLPQGGHVKIHTHLDCTVLRNKYGASLRSTSILLDD